MTPKNLYKSNELDQQLMVVSAHRYCLGRATYIVGACIKFLSDDWDCFTQNTKSVIIRDTIEGILSDCAGMEMDKIGWDDFVLKHLQSVDNNWLRNQICHLQGYEKYIVTDIAGGGNT